VHPSPPPVHPHPGVPSGAPHPWGCCGGVGEWGTWWGRGGRAWGGEGGQSPCSTSGTGRALAGTLAHITLPCSLVVQCRAVPALALGKPASTLNCACGRCQGKGVGPGPLLVPSLEGGVEVCHCHCHWHTGRARCMRVCGVARPAVTVARVLAARDAVRGVWVGRVVA
jgi:hypothetical protein